MKFVSKQIKIRAEKYKPGMEDSFLYKFQDPNNPKQLNRYPKAAGEIPVKIPCINTRYGGRHRIKEGDWIVYFENGSKEVMDSKKLYRNYEPIEGNI